MSELKPIPCPFCGGHARADTDHNNGIKHAGCADADCIGFLVAYDFVTEEAAIAAWNRRPQPEATKPAQDLSAAILAIPLPEIGGNFQQGFRTALRKAAAIASSANALSAGGRVDAITDTQRIDHIEAWSANNKARNMHWNTFCFDVDSSVREQLDAAIQAQKDGHG